MRTHKYSLFFILISFFLLSMIQSCAEKTKEQDLAAVLESEIPKLMEEAGIPGLSMAVVRDERILWTGAFGVRGMEKKEPVDVNTMFEAASLSKTVTAYAALRLVERGQLELDRPLFEYFPDQKYQKLEGDERYKQLTARIVMTHTTGLPNWGTEFVREPGEQFGYSGEGFLYLGRAIEEISGMSLQQFAREEIFEPLGMEHTSYVWNDIYAENGASGHDRHGVVNARAKRTSPNGAASLLTTAEDYARFICAILNSQGLSQKTIDRMISAQVKATKWESSETDEFVSWGWGWGIQPGLEDTGFWHWGDNGDLRAYTVAYKNRGEGLVYFANSENGLAIMDAVTSLVLKDHQYAVDWLGYVGYQAYDDPERVAGLAIERTFLERGKEDGLQVLLKAQKELSDQFDEGDLDRIAQYLNDRGKTEEAIAVYEECLKSFPEAFDAYLGLGTAYMGTGQNQASLRNFEKALEIEPESGISKRGVQWAKAAIQAERNPVELSLEEKERFVGDYGPRHITLREGTLYYQREGRPGYVLNPLGKDTFSLQGYAPFRIRFESNAEGNVIKIVGLYIRGNQDESLRDH